MKTLKTWAAAAAIVALTGAAQAALIDRGGGMIYDTTRNITWLADMNYAFTSGYAAANVGGTGSNQILADGRMGWNAAVAWADQLVYGGFDDWRLPTLNPADASCTGGFGVGFGFNCTGGELSGLFVTDLGYNNNGSGLITSDDTAEQIANLALFSNVQSYVYWSGSVFAPDPSFAWGFFTNVGGQFNDFKGDALYAVAVRPGDVTASVPEPPPPAGVDLDATPSGAQTYACELTNATTVFASPNLTATHLVGPGISVAVQKFFKYTLTNGTFQTPLTSASLFVGALPAGNVTIVQGGGLGDSSVIFQVSPSAAVNVGDSVVLVIPDVNPGDVTMPVGLTYEMYDTLGGAQNSILIQRNYIKTGALVDACASGLAFSATPNTTTADVDAAPMPYHSFFDGVPGASAPLLAKIGNVEFQPATPVLSPATNAQVVMSELVKGGTKLVLKTNQSWASLAVDGVFLSTGPGNCNAPSGGIPGVHQGVVVDPTTIDIPTNATSSATRAICYLANGTTPIDVQDFTVAFDVVPQTGATTTDQAAVPAGKFIRNGTILKHSFAKQAGALAPPITHSVQLANTTAIAAPFTVVCRNTTSIPAINTSPTFVLLPGQARHFNLTGPGGLGCSASNARSVELIFGVPNGSVYGTMVRTDATTGAVSFDQMIGSQIGTK